MGLIFLFFFFCFLITSTQTRMRRGQRWKFVVEGQFAQFVYTYMIFTDRKIEGRTKHHQRVGMIQMEGG